MTPTNKMIGLVALVSIKDSPVPQRLVEIVSCRSTYMTLKLLPGSTVKLELTKNVNVHRVLGKGTYEFFTSLIKKEREDEPKQRGRKRVSVQRVRG